MVDIENFQNYQKLKIRSKSEFGTDSNFAHLYHYITRAEWPQWPLNDLHSVIKNIMHKKIQSIAYIRLPPQKLKIL